MFKKLTMILILPIVFVGCNNNNDIEETTTICEIDSMQNVDMQIDGNRTVTLEATGDRVVRMEEINRMDIERFSGFFDMDKEEFLRWWDEDEEFVREIFMDATEILISGVTVEILDVTDEYFITRVDRNFDEMSLAELEHFTGQPVDFVSLNETIEGAEIYEEGVCIQQ